MCQVYLPCISPCWTQVCCPLFPRNQQPMLWSWCAVCVSEVFLPPGPSSHRFASLCSFLCQPKGWTWLRLSTFPLSSVPCAMSFDIKPRHSTNEPVQNKSNSKSSKSYSKSYRIGALTTLWVKIFRAQGPTLSTTITGAFDAHCPSWLSEHRVPTDISP